MNGSTLRHLVIISSGPKGCVPEHCRVCARRSGPVLPAVVANVIAGVDLPTSTLHYFLMPTDIPPLPLPASRHLVAAQGWLELGNWREANEELEQIAPALRAHPSVLELRWQIYADAEKWDACLEIAQGLVNLRPKDEFGYIHRSYALHELNRTQEAFDLLLPVALQFPRVWTIPYNLACYCAQLGRLEECKEWFKKAMAVDEKPVRQAAIDDPDLKPLWDSLSGTMWRKE